jgi:hypothetical protein
MHRIIAALVSIIVIVSSANTFGQTPGTADYAAQVSTIQTDPKVKAANDFLDKHHDEVLREWSAITEINAPSGQEGERASYLEKLLRSYKLQDIHYDAARNLIALRKGQGGGRTVVFDAHMDTGQPGLKIKDRDSGRPHLRPGDGTHPQRRSPAVQTRSGCRRSKRKVIWSFTTEEETGAGGARHFAKENKGKVDCYVALDGGYEGFTPRASASTGTPPSSDRWPHAIARPLTQNLTAGAHH